MIDRCGKSIAEPRFSDSIEGYIIADTITDIGSGETSLRIFIRNYGTNKKVLIEIEVCNNIVDRRYIDIQSGERYDFELYVKPKEECIAKLIVNGKVLDLHEIKQIDYGAIDKPTHTIIVFHNHQPPNYGSDLVYRSLWPFIYIWSPLLFPYGLGPYHYQAILLRKIGESAKLTYNLSPSLIKQWKDIVEYGIKTSSGEFIESSSDLALIVKETMDMYRELSNLGFIEVLTSIYAHTIAGYLVDNLGLENIIYRELEYGYNITKEFIGKDPRGIWLPEMSFSMKLIRIISSLGIEYTFLDEKHHLLNAQGDILNHFEPYVVQDSITGETIIVFFRDTELSNDIGFKTNFCSDIHAVKGAYIYILKLIDKAVKNKAKVFTIALDGENWMIFSKNPLATAIFLEEVLRLFDKASRAGITKLMHPSETLNKISPSRKLRFIPSVTWLGSYRKWRGEVEEQERYWRSVEQRIERFKRYISRYGFDEKARKAEWALWHILDSDYWWAEFWNKEAISMWINEFDKYLT